MFVVNESYRYYKVFIQKLVSPVYGTKEEKAQFLCREYVKSLEKTLRQYPEQWYNFFPFWEEQKFY